VSAVAFEKKWEWWKRLIFQRLLSVFALALFVPESSRRILLCHLWSSTSIEYFNTVYWYHLTDINLPSFNTTDYYSDICQLRFASWGTGPNILYCCVPTTLSTWWNLDTLGILFQRTRFAPLRGHMPSTALIHDDKRANCRQRFRRPPCLPLPVPPFPLPLVLELHLFAGKVL
jgi:hypothetical protein